MEPEHLQIWSPLLPDEIAEKIPVENGTKDSRLAVEIKNPGYVVFLKEKKKQNRNVWEEQRF